MWRRFPREWLSSGIGKCGKGSVGGAVERALGGRRMHGLGMTGSSSSVVSAWVAPLELMRR